MQSDGNSFPELDDDTIIQFGEIDLAMEEVLRSFDDFDLEFGDGDIDRAIIIYHLRMAYVQGYRDCYDQAQDALDKFERLSALLKRDE